MLRCVTYLLGGGLGWGVGTVLILLGKIATHVPYFHLLTPPSQIVR